MIEPKESFWTSQIFGLPMKLKIKVSTILTQYNNVTWISDC